jgi:Mn-dependent DtxR family transcriptional regulator
MIETDIDKMMNILEANKSISIGELSKQLNVKVELIENWAKILEEHGLIEIDYPIIGLPKLRKKEWKEEL